MLSLTLGVIADTHIPDRAKKIPLAALELFSQRGVAAILHAGDLSTSRVLRQLGEIAPVQAIRGNTDLMLAGRLPWVRQLDFGGINIGMAHGHGSWAQYIPDKWHYVRFGPKKFSHYEELARSQLPDCRVVVCGHTHLPANYWQGEQLIFNPGSPTVPNAFVPGLPPSIGLLHIQEGNVWGEIVFV